MFHNFFIKHIRIFDILVFHILCTLPVCLKKYPSIHIYSCRTKRARNLEVHIYFFMSYPVPDHIYTQLYTWILGLCESRELSEATHRAGYLFPRCSVEARSVRGTGGKNIALKFNLSPNCTHCICISIMLNNYRMDIYCIIFNLI